MILVQSHEQDTYSQPAQTSMPEDAVQAKLLDPVFILKSNSLQCMYQYHKMEH